MTTMKLTAAAQETAAMHEGHYGRFAAMIALHFIAMYVLMYAMVDVVGNVYNSLNQAYMAGLMTASMVLIELPLMAGMYRSRRLNTAIVAIGIIALAGCFVAIRQQAAIGDRQFLRSMIPHHAGAILMCERAPIDDAELRALCTQIVASQQAEIDQMKGMLERLAKTQ